MIIGVTELRRLGLVRKPAIVVPNHMLEQFAREWLQLYPQARVLVARRDDLPRRPAPPSSSPAAPPATGTAIVMSRSAFERIPLSADEQAAYLDRELDQMRGLARPPPSSGDGLTVKRLRSRVTAGRGTARAPSSTPPKTRASRSRRPASTTCASTRRTGTRTCVPPPTSPTRPSTGRMRASDLDMKIDYLRRRNGAPGRHVRHRHPDRQLASPRRTSCSATCAPTCSKPPGSTVFDTWAATFGQVVTQVELAPEGGDSFRVKSRFARFRNVPELLRMWHVFADVKTAADLDLPVPAWPSAPATASGYPRPSPSSRPTS